MPALSNLKLYISNSPYIEAFRCLRLILGPIMKYCFISKLGQPELLDLLVQECSFCNLGPLYRPALERFVKLVFQAVDLEELVLEKSADILEYIGLFYLQSHGL